MTARLAIVTVVASLLLAMPGRAEISFSGGAGSGTADAVVILGASGSRDGVRAEYVWVAINRPGWDVLMQALTSEGDRYFDVLTLQKGDQTETVYFDITDFFGK